MLVRRRSGADLDECTRIARSVNELDGYPAYLPTSLREFIASPDAVAAWVAEHDGEIVGQVALHRRSSAAVVALASAMLELPAERLGVVARLLVSPGSRRSGVGRSLLHVASQEAATRGLWPILDVAVHYQPAIGLYESCGWIRAGRVAVQLPDGETFEEYVYVGPRPQRSGRG